MSITAANNKAKNHTATLGVTEGLASWLCRIINNRFDELLGTEEWHCTISFRNGYTLNIAIETVKGADKANINVNLCDDDGEQVTIKDVTLSRGSGVFSGGEFCKIKLEDEETYTVYLALVKERYFEKESEEKTHNKGEDKTRQTVLLTGITLATSSSENELWTVTVTDCVGGLHINLVIGKEYVPWAFGGLGAEYGKNINIPIKLSDGDTLTLTSDGKGWSAELVDKNGRKIPVQLLMPDVLPAGGFVILTADGRSIVVDVEIKEHKREKPHGYDKGIQIMNACEPAPQILADPIPDTNEGRYTFEEKPQERKKTTKKQQSYYMDI